MVGSNDIPYLIRATEVTFGFIVGPFSSIQALSLDRGPEQEIWQASTFSLGSVYFVFWERHYILVLYI